MGRSKLKDLKLVSVDLVQRGANPDANICLFKSADNSGEDLQQDRFYKRLLDMFKTAFTTSTEAEDKIIKDAVTFSDIKNVEETRRLLWNYVDALGESLRSITDDKSIDSTAKLKMFQSSLSQFNDVMTALIPSLSTINTADTSISEPVTAIKTTADKTDNSRKGELTKMKFDKSKLTKEEAAEFDRLCKKCEADPEENPPGAKNPADNPVAKEVTPTTPAVGTEPDIKKSDEPNPVLKAALDEVAEMKKTIEMNTLKDIAKKYVLLGKSEDDLAKTLYALKKSGQENYDSYIAILDENLEMVEKSGIFGEIGKSSHGANSNSSDNIEARIHDIAKGYVASDPNLNFNDALVKAWEANPDLLAEYEKGGH